MIQVCPRRAAPAVEKKEGREIEYFFMNRSILETAANAWAARPAESGPSLSLPPSLSLSIYLCPSLSLADDLREYLMLLHHRVRQAPENLCSTVRARELENDEIDTRDEI